MLGYMGIYKTLKTIETLALHERVPKLVTVVLYIPILPSIPYNNIYSPIYIYIYKECYSVEQEFPFLLIFTNKSLMFALLLPELPAGCQLIMRQCYNVGMK